MPVIINRPFEIEKSVCNGCTIYSVQPYRVVYADTDDITKYDSSISVSILHDDCDCEDSQRVPDVSIHLGGYDFTVEQLSAIEECLRIIREVAENPPKTYCKDWPGHSDYDD